MVIQYCLTLLSLCFVRPLLSRSHRPNMGDEAVEFLIHLYTGEANEYKELQTTFGNYVREWIKNNGDDDELKDIAYNFVVYDGGQYLITNQDASKLV